MKHNPPDRMSPSLPSNDEQDEFLFGFPGLFALVMIVVAILNAVFGFIGK